MDPHRLTNIAVAEYRLDLVRPFGAAGRPVTERRGLVIRLTTEDGAEGFGEIAPLPGLHEHSLDQARQWVDTLAHILVGRSTKKIRDLMLRAAAPRVVSWGFETAQIGARARQRNMPPGRLLAQSSEGACALTQVPVNGLFDGDEADLERALDGLARYGTIKVKVGRRPAATERAVLARLVADLPDVRLRIDANRQLGLDSARQVIGDVPVERIEYVEEPVVDPAHLVRFHEATGLNIALDETLRTSAGRAAQKLDAVTTLIVKPALQGGVFETILGWARGARASGKRIVLSSALESGLGLSIIAQLASVVHEDGVAAGLATDRLLRSDIVEPRFDTSSGSVSVDDWTGTPSDAFIAASAWRSPAHDRRTSRS